MSVPSAAFPFLAAATNCGLRVLLGGSITRKDSKSRQLGDFATTLQAAEDAVRGADRPTAARREDHVWVRLSESFPDDVPIREFDIC